MSNLSLMNPGTSLNFDGAALQNQEEAEYRKEEEQQQHELRQLLTNAFDDLLDDDILSVTSDDSVNVSGCQDLTEGGRTPRRKRASGRILAPKASSQEWGYPASLPNGRREPGSHDIHYTQSHGETPNFGGTYNLSSQAPVREYGSNEYTNPESVTDYKGQGYLHWGGSVEHLDPGRGHIEVTEQAQKHDHMPAFHYQPHYDNDAERMDSLENRIIIGVERGETEGGNEHLRAEAQNQLWSQNYNQHFRDLYRENDIPGGDNSHEQFQTGTDTFGNTHQHLDNEIQINFANGQTLPDKAYGFGHESGQFSLNTESQPMEPHYNQTYHSSLASNINEGMIRHMTHRQDVGIPLQGPPSPRKQDYPESYKVQYKAPQPEQPISSANQMQPEQVSANQESAGNHRDFLQQDGGEDERQLGQLQILYKARGRQLEDLQRDLETLKQESGRENRILKHQLSLAQGEKEGLASSYRQCQELLQETKDENAQLLGKLQAVEAQVESLNTIRDEYVKKLQTTESTIENLTHELSNLQQSDSLARARNQHEAVVNSMQQKFDKEVLDLKEKLDIANESINQKNSEISSQRQQLIELTQVSEKSQISRAETINRLTKSLEESQRRCQSLLETASSQEVSELKISLKQMTASQKMSSEMCDTLQNEVKELKEQLSMYESASTLGIFSNTQTRSGLGDDSMTDLGIRKTLDFSTPRSQAKFDGSQSSSELITSLKVELERCLTSNRQKRSQVSKIQEELREYKKEVKALRGENSQLEKLTEEQKTKLQDFEELVQPGQKMSAVEARLRKDIENLTREKTALLEDNEELKKRLEEVGANDERLTEINQELTNQISQMVRDYDHDKRDALERCQRTCDQVHEDARDMLRQELETKFSVERAQIVTKYETEIAKIRSDLMAAQQELDKVKDLYVRTSEERTELEDVLTKQFEEKKDNEMKILRDELEREKQEELERQLEQLDIKRGELRTQVMDEVKVAQEEEVKQRLEAELAKARVDWLGEQDTGHVRQEVRQAVEKEMTLKHEAALEDTLQEKIEQAKVTWMAERKILFESEIQQRMQTEKVTWQQLANQRLEEAVNTAIDQAKAQWLKTEDTRYEDLLESAKAKWQTESDQQLVEAVSAAVEKAKQDWEETAAELHEVAVESRVKERLKTEKTLWQVEADALHEVDIKHAVESAHQKWMSERTGRESMDPAFQNRLQAEKQKWQLETDRKLQLEVNRVMERAQKQGLSEVEKKNLVEEEVSKRLEVERERWRMEMEARVLAEVETTVKATETEWRRQEEEERKKMREALENEIGGRLRQEMNRAVEDARQEWENKHLSQHATLAAGQSAAEVTRSILEQEVETLKLEKTRLVNELKEKESVWLQDKQTLISQKEAERRQAVKEVAEQCERDYKAFMEEHQNTLTEALRNSRQQQDSMEQEKRELQERIKELTDGKSQELQMGQGDLSTSITVDGDLETSILEQEREEWQKQTDKLKKSIKCRDTLLKQADAHMSQEVERLREELEAAYQQQLEMEVHKLRDHYQSELNESLPTGEHEIGKIQVQIQKMAENFEKERASYIRKIEHLEDQLAEKSQQLIDLEQEQEQEMKEEYKKELNRLLQEKNTLIEKLASKQSELDERLKENDKLTTSVKKMESAYKNDMKSQKEKFDNINNRLQKSEKSLQEVIKVNSLEKEELKNALSESEAAMRNLTQKMMERQKTNTMTVEAMKKQHKLEKKELLRQLKKRNDRTMTSTPVQTEESGDMMLDLRSQYLDTVDKIREDVMQHITQTNLRAADTVRTGITREKQVTVTQLKRFYRVSIRKILQNELIGADLEGKLAAIDQALEAMSISLSSSRSNTPDQEVKASDLSQAKSSNSSISLDVSSTSNLTPRSESSVTSSGSSCQNFQVTLSQANRSSGNPGTGNPGTGSEIKQNSKMVPKNGKDVFPRPSHNLSLFDRNGSRILITPSPVEPEPETTESLSASNSKDNARSFRPVDPPERHTSTRPKSGQSTLQTGKTSEAKPRELNSYGKLYDNDGFRRPREPVPKRKTNELVSSYSQSIHGSSQCKDTGSHQSRSSEASSYRAHERNSSHRAHSIDTGSNRVHGRDTRSHPEPQLIRDSSLPPSVSKRHPQMSLLRRSMEDEFSTPKPLQQFSYKGMSKAQSEIALNMLADFDNSKEERQQVIESTGKSPVQIKYKYTPLRQSLQAGSPSTSLISNHSLSEGDLRITENDEPVLNFQSLGLGKPSPRKFNPVPERLESESGYHTPKKSPKNLFGNKMARSLENLSVLGLTLEEQSLEEEFAPLASLKSDKDSSSFRAFERVGEFPAQLEKGRQSRHTKSGEERQLRERQSDMISPSNQTKGFSEGGDQVRSNQSALRSTSRTNAAHSYQDFHKGRQYQSSRDHDSGRGSFQTPPVNVSGRASKTRLFDK